MDSSLNEEDGAIELGEEAIEHVVHQEVVYTSAPSMTAINKPLSSPPSPPPTTIQHHQPPLRWPSLTAQKSTSPPPSHQSQTAQPPVPHGVQIEWACPHCDDKVYPSERALSNHRVKAHKEKLIPTCEVCGDTFPNSSRLGAHRRKIHPEQAVKRAELKKNEGGLVCGVCKLTFSAMSLLCSHLMELHNEAAIIEEKSFKNWSEFEAWKREVETLDRCRFVRKQGSIIPTKYGERHYFDCHRSGKMRLIARGKRMAHRANNLHPTRKIGFHCSAHMYIFVGNELADSQRVNVQYCRHHYGHDRALHWLPIPDECRERIMSLLTQKWTRDQVYAEIQKEARLLAHRNVPGADRLELITRHDIANIEKQLQFKPQRDAKKREREETRKSRVKQEKAKIQAKDRTGSRSSNRRSSSLNKRQAAGEEEEEEEECEEEETDEDEADGNDPIKDEENGKDESSPSPSLKKLTTKVQLNSSAASQGPRKSVTIKHTTRSGRRTNFDANMKRILAWESSGRILPTTRRSASAAVDNDQEELSSMKAESADGTRAVTIGTSYRAKRKTGPGDLEKQKMKKRRERLAQLKQNNTKSKSEFYLWKQIKDHLLELENESMHCQLTGLRQVLKQVKELKAVTIRLQSLPEEEAAEDQQDVMEEAEEIVQDDVVDGLEDLTAAVSRHQQSAAVSHEQAAAVVENATIEESLIHEQEQVEMDLAEPIIQSPPPPPPPPASSIHFHHQPHPNLHPQGLHQGLHRTPLPLPATIIKQQQQRSLLSSESGGGNLMMVRGGSTTRWSTDDQNINKKSYVVESNGVHYVVSSSSAEPLPNAIAASSSSSPAAAAAAIPPGHQIILIQQHQSNNNNNNNNNNLT